MLDKGAGLSKGRPRTCAHAHARRTRPCVSRFARMHVCTYVCVQVCARIRTCLHMHQHACACTCLACAFPFVHACMEGWVCVCGWVPAWRHVCASVCLHLGACVRLCMLTQLCAFSPCVLCAFMCANLCMWMHVCDNARVNACILHTYEYVCVPACACLHVGVSCCKCIPVCAQARMHVVSLACI